MYTSIHIRCIGSSKDLEDYLVVDRRQQVLESLQHKSGLVAPGSTDRSDKSLLSHSSGRFEIEKEEKVSLKDRM
jgi:hypothetical protein